MAIEMNDYVASLPEAERATIAARAAELLVEEATLRQLRDVRERSQEEIAKRLGVRQAAVSRLERRADMYVSTLRSLIQTMGGELDIVTRFPDRPPVHITQFQALEGETHAGK